MSLDEQVLIAWLDDNPEHKEDAHNLSLSRGSLKTVFLLRDQFADYLNSKEAGSVDLFLIDDILAGAPGNQKTKGSLGKRGFTYAAAVRERFPETPIYMFSAWKDVDGIFRRLSEATDRLADLKVDLKDIQRKGSDFLYYDALDYRNIRKAAKNDVNALYMLLKAPEADYRKILLILPEGFKNGISSNLPREELAEGSSIAFARWIRSRLLALPGLLYDASYSAVKLGMSEKKFLENSKQLAKAEYIGVFSRSLRHKLWWSSELDSVLFGIATEKYNDRSTTDVRKIVRYHFNLDDSELSRCAVCENLYPDTIGLNEYDEGDRQPVHYSCSVPHPKKTRVLYFDEIRMFTPRKG